MAKKFSLKDNPIFQRLEAVKPKETEPSVGESPPSEETPPSQDLREPSFEGLNVTLTDRASKYDPQSLTPIEQKETAAQTVSESVTSQDLRGAIFEGQNMPLKDSASKHDSQKLISTEQRETLDQVVTEPTVSQDIEEFLHEDQNVTLTNRPSKYDPQQMLPKNSEETSARSIVEHAVLQDFEESPYEGQNMTLINRASKFDLQQSFPRMQEKMSAQDPVELLAPSLPSPSTSSAPDLGLQEHLDGALFPSLFNEIIDELLPTLDLAEQALYIRFFRLSYGFHRNYCTVSQPLLMERTGLSRNTIRTTLQSLSRKGWIRTIETGNRISTTYRVVLPRERVESDRERSSIFEGQNLDLQNLTLREPRARNHPADLPLPIRGPDWSLILLARELVEKFYSRFGQRPSKTKREKNIQECLNLFKKGFTVEEIDYATSWLIEHHPMDDPFSRLAYFTHQALEDLRTNRPDQHA